MSEQDAVCDWAQCHQGPLSDGMEHSSASSFWKDEAAGVLVQELWLVIGGRLLPRASPTLRLTHGCGEMEPRFEPRLCDGRLCCH